MEAESPQVFISYSHDSNEHGALVLSLSERLREDGIETSFDQYVAGTPAKGWPRWMLDQLDEADFVLMICTETYYRRFRGHEVPGKGKGVDWEGAIITQEIYNNRSETTKFVPVLFDEKAEGFIPEPARGHTFYLLTSEAGYQGLYDFLLDQSGVEPQKLGRPKRCPRPLGQPLTFQTSPVPTSPTETTANRTPRTGATRGRFWTVALIVLFALAIGSWLRWSQFGQNRQGPSQHPAALGPLAAEVAPASVQVPEGNKVVTAVAILFVPDLWNAKGNGSNPTGAAIADRFNVRLAALPGVKVVNSAEFRKLSQYLVRAPGDLDGQTARDLGRILGASHLVLGSFAAEPGGKEIRITFEDLQSKTDGWSQVFTGRDQDEVETAAVAAIAGRLGKTMVRPRDPGDSFRNGLILFRTGRLGEALPLLWEAVTKNPDDLVLHRTVHECAKEAGLGKDLIDKYGELAAARPREGIVRNYYGNALCLVDPKDEEGRAAEQYRKSLELQPGFAPPVNNLATIELNNARHSTAMQGFEAYLALDPTDAIGWSNLGNACVGKLKKDGERVQDASGLRRKAESAYLQAIELDPSLAGAWRGLGALREFLGERVPALDAFRRSLQLDPRQRDLQERLGPEGEKDGAGARHVSDLALPAELRGRVERRFEEGRVSAAYCEAVRRFEDGQVQEALVLLDSTLKEDGGNPLCWLTRAKWCDAAGQKESVAKALSKAVEIRPSIKSHLAYRELLARARGNP